MLPFALLGLLASSLPALLAAAPIEHGGLQLNAQNFDSTVSKGMYLGAYPIVNDKPNSSVPACLVEFYSPYCGHCRKFAPTWQSLTQTDFEDTHDRFSFAQLDCVANGDACAAQKITGYPTLWLYKDGEKVAEYTSTREIPAITQWLDERVDKRDVVVDPVVPPVQLPHDREQQKAEAIQEADKANQGTPELPKQPREDDTQPDAQRLVIQQRKASPPTANGSVIPLDKESFESLHKSDAGPLFVKLLVDLCCL